MVNMLTLVDIWEFNKANWNKYILLFSDILVFLISGFMRSLYDII